MRIQRTKERKQKGAARINPTKSTGASYQRLIFFTLEAKGTAEGLHFPDGETDRNVSRGLVVL